MPLWVVLGCAGIGLLGIGWLLQQSRNDYQQPAVRVTPPVWLSDQQKREVLIFHAVKGITRDSCARGQHSTIPPTGSTASENRR